MDKSAMEIMESLYGPLLRQTRQVWFRIRLLEGLLQGLAFLLCALFLGLLADNLLTLPAWLRISLVVVSAFLFLFLLARGLKRALGLTRMGAALLVERQNPHLDQLVVNSLLLARDPEAAGSGFLPHLVEEGRKKMDSARPRPVLSSRDLKRPAWTAGLGTVLIALHALLLPSYFQNAAHRFMAPGAAILPLTRTICHIKPGHVILREGDTLVVEATPLGEMPERAFLEIQSRGAVTRQGMDYGGGAFLLSVKPVTHDFQYRVLADDFESLLYEVKVKSAPRPRALRITLDYPAYTGMAPQVLEEVGDITALEGTEAALEIIPDRAIAQARLSFDDGEEIGLEPNESGRLGARFTLTGDRTYQVILVDEEGVGDPDPPVYRITALVDELPRISMEEPAGDLLSPRGVDLAVLMEARDDVGLGEAILLWTASDPKDKKAWQVAARWDFEAGTREARPAGLLPLGSLKEKEIACKAMVRDRAGQSAESPIVNITLVNTDMKSGEGGDSAGTGEGLGESGSGAGKKDSLKKEGPGQAQAREALETLNAFAKAQQEVIRSTEALLEEEKKEGAPSPQEEREALKATEERWGKVLKSAADDYEKLHAQDFSDSTLVDEFIEMYSEVELAADALTQQPIEIAVTHEQVALELAESLVAELERWLEDQSDHKKWTMEEPPEDYEVPLADLPDELEDMVGDLIDSEDAMTEAVEDLTSGWLDSLDAGAGWGAADGPISNMSAKGVTGNLLPNNQEVGGRSGEGRTGKSMGQFVEKTAQGKEGRQTPTRITPDPYETGRVDDTSKEMEGGSTGGGKVSGSGPEGLRGPAPPEVQEAMDRLSGQQAEIREEGEKLKIALGRMGYFPQDLEMALEGMTWMEEALKRYEKVNYSQARRNIVGRLNRLKTVVEAALRFDREKMGHLPGKVRTQLQSAFEEPRPMEFEALISSYYRSLAEKEEE